MPTRNFGLVVLYALTTAFLLVSAAFPIDGGDLAYKSWLFAGDRGPVNGNLIGTQIGFVVAVLACVAAAASARAFLGPVAIAGGIGGLAGLMFNSVPDGGAGGHLLACSLTAAVLVGLADSARLLGSFLTRT